MKYISRKYTPALCLVVGAMMSAGFPAAVSAQAPGSQSNSQLQQNAASATTQSAPLLRLNQQAGEHTRSLLQIQRSGVQASPNRQYVSGPEMRLIYRRYLESFTHPIPDFFIKPDFSAE